MKGIICYADQSETLGHHSKNVPPSFVTGLWTSFGRANIIFTAARSGVWIQESEVQNPDSPDYRKLAFGGGPSSLGTSSVENVRCLQVTRGSDLTMDCANADEHGGTSGCCEYRAVSVC